MMKKDELKQQSITAKKAEVERPHIGKRMIDDPNKRSVFTGRAADTLHDLRQLIQKWGIEISPFLEIGAGSGQRSAALMNNFDVQGVATEISLNSLTDTAYILKALDYKLSPTLICCDAHYLPFQPDSFQFVFAYQTFHHFENPVPVFAECYRVLAKDGYLYFNEEPLDSKFRRFLRGHRMLSHPPTNLQRIGYRLGVEKVFWDDGALERSLGMTEARFDIEIWNKCLEPFSIIDIEVNRKLRIHTDLRKPTINSLLSSVIGGNVKGLCKKLEGESISGNFFERLICLDCNSNQITKKENSNITCDNCKRIYPIHDGVIRMLPKQLEDELYQ